ncbi:unnamed protein product [Cylicocyclus nassatus]|uniref:Major facilitator superfamily (MFS) profile domain-containing protein n=1 Tax=Cylicocyclus nassatus TaxID=53992 RepID=A0AA36MA82_CYLNA|nr:unnamed protein product [Cylicocyclus nassatus]
MVNTRKDYISITILFIVNLLNFVDRYTVAGVLTQVQEYYDIDNSMAGLIQTVFIAFFMIGSPLCGFNRKIIIIAGVATWLAAVVASSFVPANNKNWDNNKQNRALLTSSNRLQLFWLFLLLRGVVGIGEASYSNVCPSMISDMFTGTRRSRMYMVFYFAVPVGSGLGFIVGSNAASILGSWQWGIRITAVPGIVALILLVLFVHDPERGAADKIEGAHLPGTGSSYWQDLKALIRIPTFVSCTWAYTALIFVTGTLVWWEPTIIEHGIAWNKGENDTASQPDSSDHIGLVFGGITTLSGLLGVTAGTVMAGMMRKGRGIFRPIKTERAQPIVSGLGALISAPLLAVIFIWGHHSITMLWSVIVPSRRSTAFSYFMLISHLFGDATGPYIVGAVSDAIRGEVKTPKNHYLSLVKACSVTVVLLFISAALYFVSAATLLRDQKKFKDQMGKYICGYEYRCP